MKYKFSSFFLLAICIFQMVSAEFTKYPDFVDRTINKNILSKTNEQDYQ